MSFWDRFATNINKIASFPDIFRSAFNKDTIMGVFPLIVVDRICVFVGRVER
jgi:hypothetical protein